MNWKILRVAPEQTLLDALAVIDRGTCQLALVTDNDHHLLGVLSDGDIRRALLKGKDLLTLVSDIMTTTPLTVTHSEGRSTALLRLRQEQLRHIPVLDVNGCVCDLWTLEELLDFKAQPYPVVLMAGGLGSRLSPLTEDTPKPMLPVGGQPLLELTLQHFLHQGFRQFYISVNYKAQTIIDYFGDGLRMGADITYIHETKRMGTAGALSLLPPITQPCIVMNADILTRLNFTELMAAHIVQQAVATMVVKMHTVQIPYGVVHYDEQGHMKNVEEKPEYRFPISAGINVFSPQALKLIPKDSFFDMPDLFQALLHNAMQPSVYEMTEYWLDIGHISDYRRANEEVALRHMGTP